MFVLSGDHVKDFFRAVKEDNYDLILQIPIDFDINIKDEDGHTALYYAITRKEIEIIRYLLKKGINPHIGNVWLLHNSLNDNDIFDLLIEYSKNFTPGERFQFLLHYAAMGSTPEIIEKIINLGFDINAKNADADTPLLVAVRSNQEEMVKILLSHHADPNIKSSYGRTPLKIATLNRKKSIVQILLENGAKSNMSVEIDGKTSLMIAAENKDYEIMKMLLENNADPLKTDNKGRSVKHFLPAFDEIMCILLIKEALEKK